MNCIRENVGGAPSGPAACLIGVRPIEGASHCFSAGLRCFVRPASPPPRRDTRMATAAPNLQLPLFYQTLEPLNVTQHGKMKVRQVLKMNQIGSAHAVPVTVDEFGLAQR